MDIIKTVLAMQTFVHSCKAQDKSIALVATMGGIHKGHLALLKQAKQLADVVIVSIFVNPTQFGEDEDLATYPRNLAEDSRLLADYSPNIIFVPSLQEIYPFAQGFRLVAPSIANQYCGKSRPAFFHGISLVVVKLFNIIRPDYACFGEKDYQQLHIVKLLVKDFFLTTKIISVATVRDDDGLAMSTRNKYLCTKQRQIAVNFYQILVYSKAQIKKGKALYKVKKQAIMRLNYYFEVDYFEVIDAKTLLPTEKYIKNMYLISAVYLGKIRLIDNIKIC